MKRISYPFTQAIKFNRNQGRFYGIFKEKQENIDYEILKVFSYILSEYIKRQIERENLELDEKLKDFYLSKEKSGYIKIIDNVLFLYF